MEVAEDYMEDLIEKLQTHLEELGSDPSVEIDSTITDRVDEDVRKRIPKPDLKRLIDALSALIPSVRQDPTPLANVATRLTDGTAFTFEDVLRIQPPIDFVGGLKAPLASINLLILGLLEKGALTSVGISFVSSRPELSLELIRLWLTTPNVGVASECKDLLSSLLSLEASMERYSACHLDGKGDAKGSESEAGMGNLMWRRITEDRDVYSSIYSLCGTPTGASSEGPSKRDKSISQARLLELLEVSLGSPAIWSSHFPDLEQRYGVQEGGGLMHFAALRMADYEHDELVRYILLQFYTNLIVRGPQCVQRAEHAKAFQFLVSTGRHELIVKDFADGGMAYDGNALSEYIAACASRCPMHFFKGNPETLQRVVLRTTGLARQITPNRLDNDKNVSELNLLYALPRLFLLSPPSFETPLRFAAPQPLNAHVLDVLARTFRGWDQRNSDNQPMPDLPPRWANIEESAARALYFRYHLAFPNVWGQIALAAHSEDAELFGAAARFLNAFLRARWRPLPADAAASSQAPTERQLRELCRPILRTFASRDTPPDQLRLPATPFDVMVSPTVLPIVLPLLLRPWRDMGPAQRGGRVPHAHLEAMRAFRDELAERLRAGGPLPEVLNRTALLEFETAIIEGERMGFGPGRREIVVPTLKNGNH